MGRGMDGLRCNRYPMMEDDQFSPLSFPPSDLPLTSLPTSCSESVTSRVQSQTFTLESAEAKTKRGMISTFITQAD